MRFFHHKGSIVFPEINQGSNILIFKNYFKSDGLHFPKINMCTAGRENWKLNKKTIYSDLRHSFMECYLFAFTFLNNLGFQLQQSIEECYF